MSMRSVTKIIGRVFPFSANIPPHILETARQRGIAMHEWLEEFVKYKVGERDTIPTVSLEYQIYVDYIMDWFDEYEVKPIHSELKLNDGYLVGVIDMVCKTKDHDAMLISLKMRCNSTFMI